MNKKRIKIGCLLFSIILLISLTGCTKSENSIVTSITNFSLESYQERIVSDRNSLKEVRNIILDNETKKKQCNNFDFSECDFSEFPDITDVSVFSNSYRGMTEHLSPPFFSACVDSFLSCSSYLHRTEESTKKSLSLGRFPSCRTYLSILKNERNPYFVTPH